MGTYPQAKVTEARKLGRQRRSPQQGRDAIYAAFDHALAHPEEGLHHVGPKFGVGGSTMANWLNPSAKFTPNKFLVTWLRGRDPLTLDGSGLTNLVRWEELRPQNLINQRMRQGIASVVTRPKAQPKAATPDVVLVESERLIGPTGIGAFVPGTTDDLLVVKEEALRVKAEAEAVALEAAVLAAAIDTVRDWLTDKDRLQQALGRIQNLESQLRESDTILKRFQQQKLASNQVHSSD